MDAGDAEGRTEKPVTRPEVAAGSHESRGRVRQRPRQGGGHSDPEPSLMEAVLERENMRAAYLRVKGNKGAAGVDGMTVEALPAIPAGTLAADQGRAVGGDGISRARSAGIDTETGRRAAALGDSHGRRPPHPTGVAPGLQPLFDPDFSESSYGFRPRTKCAWQAVLAGTGSMWPKAGGGSWTWIWRSSSTGSTTTCSWLGWPARLRIKRVLRLIRRLLAGRDHGRRLVSARSEGTPQGGPLSPLLSNILLDDLDQELERRGHAFCRYADDCNVYVRTRRAGERVMASLSRFLAVS